MGSADGPRASPAIRQSKMSLPSSWGRLVWETPTLSFSNLQFEVPGAAAQVKGSYGLVSDKLDFTGDVRLQAHVSNTMSGAKRVLLKPIDPIFARHNAGTYLPVNVTGNKDHPQIKLDLNEVF